MTTKPLVRFAAAALAAASLVTTSAAKPKAPGQGQPGQGMPGRGNGYTKEQVVPLALAGFDTLQQALDATYKDQGYGQTVVAAKAKFQENAQAALPETNPNGQPKRYSDRELWVMQQVVDVTVRTVQDGISIMVEGRRKGVSAEDIDHNLRTMRAQNAVKIQRIVDDNAHELGSAGAGFAGGIVDHLGPDGARNSEGTPFWLDPKKSPLVVLAMESTNCVMHPEQCKITVSPPVVTPTPTPTPAPPPVVSNPTTGKPETPSNPKPEPEYPSNPQPETPAGNGGPSVDQLYSNITNGASGAGAVNVMNDRGAYLLERGRYSDALQLAKTALSLDPKNKNALALLHSVNGRVEGGAVGAAGGADAAARAAALGAGGREGFASYGSASASPAAAAALVSPGATRAAADQALAGAKSALKLGDAESALDTLTKALEQDPNNPALLNMRAQVYGRLGRWEEALRDVRAGLALAPGNVALLTTKAIAENRTRRWNDALATANEMLAADPNNAWAYAARAHAYGGLGRKDDMMRDILRAASLDAHFRQAAEDAKNIQLPSDADVMFLFPGESAKSATKSAPAASGRGRSFSVLVIAGIVGGLLLALGLLSIVMEPVKNAVTAVFTKRSESDPRAAVATAQPASVGGNVGGLIRGQYQIARQIGAGGMGMVYEGTDKSLGRRVAIKKMRDELRLNARERDRFIIEAKTVASLHHPNIVDIYAIAEEGDDVYLVFEYVDGKTVHDLVQTAGRLEPADAVNVARAMGEALTYAHAHGVIHRDMKPSNVMKTSSGQIKVMDFGIARMAKDAMTRYSMTNTVVGTPPYMAPEQEQGVVRKESDVYSLAICAYEMLTGKLPFIGMGAGMLMNKINMSYIPPSRAIAGLPESLDEVFLKAFQADPEKRYRTPQEFVAALGGSLGARAKSS